MGTPMLICKPCIAFDALGALIFSDYCRNDIPDIKEKVQSFFSDIHINPSNVFFDLLIEHHSIDEIEAFDLKTLADTYPRYIDENAYVSQYKDSILNGLKILQDVNFDEFWARECLPLLVKQSEDLLLALNENSITGLINDIQKVKQNQAITGIHISMTYFTYPVSFNLTASSYLTNYALNTAIDPNSVMQLLTHELCHGFSKSNLREIYQDAYIRDKYLKRTNWFLSVVIGSPGDEEEFVAAIEHAIAVKNGLATMEQAYEKIFYHYKSCMPITVILFSEITKLCEIPEDINTWICNKFADGTINVGCIENKVKSILPGYVERFEEFWLDEVEKNIDKMNMFIRNS